jgi:hypothetical protein
MCLANGITLGASLRRRRPVTNGGIPVRARRELDRGVRAAGLRLKYQARPPSKGYKFKGTRSIKSVIVKGKLLNIVGKGGGLGQDLSRTRSP